MSWLIIGLVIGWYLSKRFDTFAALRRYVSIFVLYMYQIFKNNNGGRRL